MKGLQDGKWRKKSQGVMKNPINLGHQPVVIKYSRLRSSGELEAAGTAIGSDLEARCRSYAEYAGSQCYDRINGLVAQLEGAGRSLLARETEGCGREVARISQQEAESEERRLTLLGDQETLRLVTQYQV